MTTEVDAVSLKLPTFWTSTPTTWFAQAEAQFIVRNITNDDTKYYYVVAALDSSTANRAKNKTCSPPPGLEPGSSDCRATEVRQVLIAILKSALNARLSGDNWIDDLPWVLLGLRVTPKEDLHSSSAELVYGEPLTIPGEFVPRNTTPWTTSNLVRPSHLPIPTTTHKILRSSVPTSLMSSRFVFIRHDAHRTPLQCPYDEPYEVLEPGD